MKAFFPPPIEIASALRALRCPPFRVVSLPIHPTMRTLLRQRFTQDEEIHTFIEKNPHLLYDTRNKMPAVLKAIYRHAMKREGLPNHAVAAINKGGHPVASMLKITPVPTFADAMQGKVPLGSNPTHIAVTWQEYPGGVLDAVQGPFGQYLLSRYPFIRWAQDRHLLMEDPMGVLPRTIAPFTKDSGIGTIGDTSACLYYGQETPEDNASLTIAP